MPQLTVLFVVSSLKTLTILAEYLSPYSVIMMPCFVVNGVPTQVFQNEAGENGVARLNDTLLFHPPASSQTMLLCFGGSPEKDAALVTQIITVSSTLTPATSVLLLSLYLTLCSCLLRVTVETMSFFYCDTLDSACKSDWFICTVLI